MFPLSPLAIARIAVVAIAFLGGMSTHKVFSDRRIATMQATWAAKEADWNRQVAEAQAATRRLEGKLQTAVDTARKDAQDAQAKIDEQARSLLRVRADRDQLHNDLSAFAAGSVTKDTLTACRDRADRLAGLVADGAAVGEELRDMAVGSAKAAQVRFTKLEACLKAWPTTH